MVSDNDSLVIRKLATRYNVSRVVLFGSSAAADRGANDIDLGVEGVSPKDFFRLYGELIFGLSRPVDLLDLSRETAFAREVREHGIPLYERPG